MCVFMRCCQREWDTILYAKKTNILYSFFNVDQIMDFLLSIGMRPFVELSFMPKALASGDTPCFATKRT